MVNLEWDHLGGIPPVESEARASAESLCLELEKTFPEFVKDFEIKFKAWQARWHDAEVPGSPR